MGIRSKIELACVWSGLTFLVTYLIFFLGVAGWIPPQSPQWSAERIGEYYADNTVQIRVGQLGAMIASFLLMPFWAVISGYIARVEKLHKGRFPVLALVQFGCAVLLQVFFVLCSMMWLIATFRPELSDDTVRVLHDGSWLIFVMVFPGYVFQMFCIGIAALIDDDPDPVLPRWTGYLNMWVGFSGVGGGLAVFFKDGAFAWNGVVGFWMPVVVFASWLIVMTYLLHTGFTRKALAEQADAARSEPPELRSGSWGWPGRRRVPVPSALPTPPAAPQR